MGYPVAIQNFIAGIPYILGSNTGCHFKTQVIHITCSNALLTSNIVDTFIFPIEFFLYYKKKNLPLLHRHQYKERNYCEKWCKKGQKWVTSGYPREIRVLMLMKIVLITLFAVLLHFSFWRFQITALCHLHPKYSTAYPRWVN